MCIITFFLIFASLAILFQIFVKRISYRISCRGLILDDPDKIIVRLFKKIFEKKDIHQEILDILSEKSITT